MTQLRCSSTNLNESDKQLELLDIFEALREKEGLDTKHYTLRDIHVWLHSFYDIQMMVYDKEINRYKRIDAKHLEALLHDQVQAALNQV